MIPFVDIHTHNLSSDKDIVSIKSIEPTENIPQTSNFFSMGIHPMKCAEGLLKTLETAIKSNHILAIGECGIDHLSSFTLDIQKELFIKQARLAETNQKPLIIHMVRSQNEIMEAHKIINPKMPWIIHGFRGKPKQARQLINKGIYLSFGQYSNNETIEITPLEQMFLETDEAKISIKSVYEKVAEKRHINIETLKNSLWKNFQRVFLHS